MKRHIRYIVVHSTATFEPKFLSSMATIIMWWKGLVK